MDDHIPIQVALLALRCRGHLRRHILCIVSWRAGVDRGRGGGELLNRDLDGRVGSKRSWGEIRTEEEDEEESMTVEDSSGRLKAKMKLIPPLLIVIREKESLRERGGARRRVYRGAISGSTGYGFSVAERKSWGVRSFADVP